MVRSFHQLPCKTLSPYIDRYWGWEGGGQAALYMPRILPGTGMELFFHFETPFSTIEHGQSRDAVSEFPRGHLMQLRQKCCQIAPIRHVGFIAVRFRGGAFRHFCPNSPGEFMDSVCSVGDIWGKEGLDFADQVIGARDIPPRVAVIEQYLLMFLQRFKQDDPMVDHAVNQIYYGGAECQLGAIADQLNIGVRHFQRTFKQALGMTPKSFQRLTRFQKTVKYLLLHNQPRYLSPALRFGFYDQSHFAREFRSFTGQKPSDYFQKKNFMSHFYNTSLSSPSIFSSGGRGR